MTVLEMNDRILCKCIWRLCTTVHTTLLEGRYHAKVKKKVEEYVSYKAIKDSAFSHLLNSSRLFLSLCEREGEKQDMIKQHFQLEGAALSLD